MKSHRFLTIAAFFSGIICMIILVSGCINTLWWCAFAGFLAWDTWLATSADWKVIYECSGAKYLAEQVFKLDY